MEFEIRFIYAEGTGNEGGKGLYHCPSNLQGNAWLSTDDDDEF